MIWFRNMFSFMVLGMARLESIISHFLLASVHVAVSCETEWFRQTNTFQNFMNLEF